MAKLIRVEPAAELLGTTKNSLMVTASAYKKENGVYPKWYISNGARGGSKSYVDMEVLDRNRQLVRSIWIMCTDNLYWLMSYDFNMSDNYIASQLARRSKLYPNANSWVSFIRKTLFQLPQETVFVLKATMLVEFMKVSKNIIAIASREGSYEGNKQTWEKVETQKI